MERSKGQSQPYIGAEFCLFNSLHGSGWTIFLPGFEYDSFGVRTLSTIHEDSRESAASLAMLSVQAVSGDVAVAGLRDSHWIAVGLHVQTNDTVLTGMG